MLKVRLEVGGPERAGVDVSRETGNANRGPGWDTGPEPPRKLGMLAHEVGDRGQKLGQERGVLEGVGDPAVAAAQKDDRLDAAGSKPKGLERHLSPKGMADQDNR